MIQRLRHRIILIFFVLLVCTQVKGQEYPWSLQYITNMYTINPAYVGMWDRAGLGLSNRVNWVGINGAALYQQVSYNTPIKDQKSGFGLNVLRLNIGREKSIAFTGDYSYQVRLDMHYYLRFGFRAGIINLDNNLNDYILYPDHINDPEFSTNVRLYYMTVFGVGAVLYNENYYISFSIPQMINNTFNVTRDLYSSMPKVTTMYLSGGYAFKIAGNLILRPNLLVVKTIGKPVYFDAAALLYFPGNLQAGIHLRSNGSMCLSGQYTFRNNLRIGYAAEYFVLPDISKYQMGTYEFFVGYDFNLYRRKNIRTNYF